MKYIMYSPQKSKYPLYILYFFYEIYSVLGEIETDNLTVLNSVIITLDFTVLKIGFSWNRLTSWTFMAWHKLRLAW